MFIFILFHPSTLSEQSHHDGTVEQHREVNQRREERRENIGSMDIQRLEEQLREERGERSRLELEKDKLRREKEILEERRERERGGSITERLQIDYKKK